MRQSDETTCFSCGSTIRREVGECPYCGSAVSAGPVMAAPATVVPGSASHSTAPGGVDTIGAGRYVINFILAGFIGLGLSYFLRNQGWLATFICIPIFILIFIYFASQGSP